MSNTITVCSAGHCPGTMHGGRCNRCGSTRAGVKVHVPTPLRTRFDRWWFGTAIRIDNVLLDAQDWLEEQIERMGRRGA